MEVSYTQSNTCARAREALALGKYNFFCAVIGLTFIHSTCRHQLEPLNVGVPVVYFPIANAFLTRAQVSLQKRKKWENSIGSLACNHPYVAGTNSREILRAKSCQRNIDGCI